MLLVNDGRERFACLPWLSAQFQGLFGWITQRERGTHQAVLRYAENLLGSRDAIADEPADARSNALGGGCKHNAFAQAALVVGLLVVSSWRARHHKDNSGGCATQMACVAAKI